MIRAVAFITICFANVALSAPPTVESVLPGGARRDTEFTLTLTGARLSNAEEILFYFPGITCSSLKAVSENEITAVCRAARDCRLGEHAFRLRTAGGVSELRTIRISALPVVAEKEPNDSPAEAQVVPLDVSVTGVIESGGTDYYSVQLKKGQRLAAEVEAVRLGGELTDAVLTVFDPHGKELLTVDDTSLFRQDPFFSIVAVTDGKHTVRVREAGSGGSESSRYVLHIGTFTRPGAIFPAGGPAGSEVSIKHFGDATGDYARSVKLPADSANFEYFATDGATTAPTPNPFRVSPFPNIIEVEPNGEPSKATANPHGWPIAFNGAIESIGDVDHYQFRAKKGDTIEVNAFAFRIGSPLDTVVAVLDSKGELIAWNDDDETHDSLVRVMIPTDGDYFIRVSDKRKQGGPRFIYRVELDRPRSSLDVFLAPGARKTQDRQVIQVPRGNRVTAFLAVRRGESAGPVKLQAGDLPRGVQVELRPIPEGEYLLPVVFEASHDAPIGGKLVEFRGEMTGTRGVITGPFRQVVNLTRGPGDSAFHSLSVSKLAVVVVDEVPVSVTVVPPIGPVQVDGTIEVEVRVSRGKDFAESLEITFPCLPPGIEAPSAVPVPADKNSVIVPLIVHPTAELGDWKLVAEARIAVVRVGRNQLAAGGMGADRPERKARSRTASEFGPVASQLVAIRVAEPATKGRFDPVVTEQGKSVRVVCRLDKPVEGAFTAKLDGLPPRTKAEIVEVKSGDREIVFQTAVDPTTPAGSQSSLVCELAGEQGGRKIVHRVGRGGVFTVSVPGGVKTDSAGKPLSPLEALRLSEKK